MKVAVVNTFDAKDSAKWSGIAYYISLFLDSLYGDNIRYVSLPEFKRSAFSYLKGFYYNRVQKKRYYTWADEKVLQRNQAAVTEFLRDDFDLIITFEFFLVPLLKTEQNKVIHWNDANFKNIHNYYDGYSNFSAYSERAAHAIQKNALALSDAVIYSSDWAIESAAGFYGTDRRKLKKILFASNFKTTLHQDDVADFISRRKSGVVKLLFLAADWERKGGSLAVDVVNALNSRGITTLLYVVGTGVPAQYRDNSHIKEFGFINKKSTDGEQRLVALFSECTFLLLPSQVDITPVVVSEATSFALPVITTQVGGLSSLVENKVNGCSFPSQQFVESAVQFISNNRPTSKGYEELCFSAYAHYQSQMSWEQVRRKFLRITNDLSVAVPA